MGGVVGAQAPQSGGAGTGKYGGMANQGGGANPFQQFQAGQGLQQVGQQTQQQQPFQNTFQQGGQQPDYAALFRNFAGMFGGQQGAPVSNYKPVQSANDFQLRNTYQFSPATDPSRQYAARVQAEADQRAANPSAYNGAGGSYSGMGDSTGGAGGSGGGGGGPAGSAGDAGGPGGPGAAAASGADAAAASGDASGDGAGTWARGGHVNPDKKIRAALLTAKGVQAKAVPSSQGINTVHTVIDPATVNHPAADIPGVHLRAGRMGKAGGGELTAPGAPAPEEEDSITAYHGSPHSFEEFDPAYIGKGEGNQSFGHGMYFADNEGVAKNYRDVLSGDLVTPEGEKTNWQGQGSKYFGRSALQQSMDKKLSGDEAIRDAMQDLHFNAGLMQRRDIKQRYYDAANSLGSMLGKQWKIDPGYMYEVRLKARPEHFLDWDKPLSEQRHVIDALSKTKGKIIRDLLNSDLMKNIDEPIKVGDKYIFQMTGRDLMHQLSGSSSGQPNHPKASAALAAAGIRGIRYLDAGSRSQGEGTHNYVVFDPKHIEVARKYEDGGRVGYAGGGGEDDPVVQQALGLTQQAMPMAQPMAQPELSPIPGAMQVAQAVTAPGRKRFEIAPARVAPMTIDQKDRDLPEEGGVTIKRLTDAFKRAIDNHLSLPPAQQIANARQAENNVAKYVGRGKTGKMNSVLTANKKLMKAQTAGEDDSPLTLPDGRTLEMTGLALMPDYREGQFKMCGNSDVCRDLCLGKEAGQYRYDKTATQTQIPTTKEELAEAGGKPRMAAFRRTMAMMRDPESFAVHLHELIDGAKIMAERRGSHLGVRLNVLSDLSPKIMEPIIKAHPEVSFYDYTKMNYDPVAPNHHYTYSSTGLSQPERGVENPFSNWRKLRDRLDQGQNVAMAFAHGKGDAFPEHLHDEETGKKYRVVSGDEHDFRPMDMVPEGEDGVIVALKNMAASNSEYKYENAARNSHGFFVHHEPNFERTAKGTFALNESGDRIPQNKIYNVPVQPVKRGAMR